MSFADIAGLFFHCLVLWFVAIGGPSALLPDIHRYVVDANRWMTSAQFAELYTLAQVAPGPNAMYVTLVGWQVAGWAGAAAMTLPLLIPAGTVTLWVARLNQRYPNAKLGKAVRRGLMPITIGLTFASATLVMRAVNHNWRGYALTAISIVFVMRTPWNPLWLLAGGAAVGMMGLL